jgi:hypothetical protein
MAITDEHAIMSLVKSKQRVADHVQVFTPSWINWAHLSGSRLCLLPDDELRMPNRVLPTSKFELHPSNSASALPGQPATASWQVEPPERSGTGTQWKDNDTLSLSLRARRN